MKSNVIHVLRTNVEYLRELAEPIDPDRMALMPTTDDGIALNPPAWILAHLAVSMSYPLKMLGGSIDLPESWFENCNMGTKPTDNLVDYSDKAELLDGLSRTAEALAAAIDSATDEQFAAPTPNEDFRKVVPTVGDAVVFIAIMHTAIHTGQLTSWLRCTGIGPRF